MLSFHVNVGKHRLTKTKTCAENSRFFGLARLGRWLTHLRETILETLCATVTCNQKTLDVHTVTELTKYVTLISLWPAIHEIQFGLCVIMQAVGYRYSIAGWRLTSIY